MATIVDRTALPRPVLLSWDLTNVLFFVAVGRTAHDIDTGVPAFTRVALPFVIALLAAWVAGRAWVEPLSTRTGLVVWAVTVVVGMTLRRLVFEGGLALPFVIVTTLYLGAVLLGWRAIARWWAGRRRPSPR